MHDIVALSCRINDRLLASKDIYVKIVFTFDPDRIKFISLFSLKSQSNLAKLKIILIKLGVIFEEWHYTVITSLHMNPS